MTGDDHHDELEPVLPADAAAGPAGAGSPDGLSWTWDLDIETLLAAVTGPAPWTRGPVTAAGQPAAAPEAAPDGADRPVPPGSADGRTPPADADSVPGLVSPAAGMSPAADADSAPDPAPSVGAATAAGSGDAGDGLDPVEADWAEYLDAVESGRAQVMPLPVVAGRVAELVPAGPGLAGWLGTGEVGGVEDGALAGIASSCRRLASWAQAGELAAVAELASRSAAADDRIGAGEDGRPARISPSACAEVSLALTMSQAAASWWADLAVTLRWRLAATGTALASGAIDLARARAIADATGFLEEDTARAVQDRVLPKAGSQTTAQLRAALRRAVIAADPAGADRRRQEAEKQARVLLYPDTEGTASLGGYGLPGIPAAAALARITALAAALKASGAGGGIDRLRAHVFLGLLLGTLPYIPPPEHAPPDQPPDNHDDSHPGDEPPGDEPLAGGQPAGGQPAGGLPADDRPGGSLPGDGPPAGGLPAGGLPGGSLPGDGPPGGEPSGGDQDGDPPGGNLPRDRQRRGRAPAGCRGTPPAGQGSHRGDGDQPAHQHGDQHPDRDADRGGSGHQPDDEGSPPADRDERRPDRGDHGSQPAARSSQAPGRAGHRPGPGAEHPGRDGPGGPHPAPGSPRNGEPACRDHAQDDVDDNQARARPPPAWPEMPALLQVGPAAMNYLTPATGAGGLLDLRLPWTTLTGQSPQPGYLGRIGPITPGQARHLADLAAADPATRWRIILTDPNGHAIATTTLARPATSQQQQAGLIKHVTVTLSPHDLTHPQPDGLPAALHRILTVARHLAGHAARRAARDTQAGDGCAHDDETASYRPATRLRDYITARDQTCRFPTCRQPAWRCDADHTTPFDQGGRTCSCNLGDLCRFHHQVKGQARWHLDQVTPGVFTWTTPTGRRYTIQPDAYAA